MESDPARILALQAVWFTLAWAALARFVVWPWGQRLPAHSRVAVWIAPQMFRVLGLGLLVPSLSPGMPEAFATSTAAGDALTSFLAMVAFVALQRERRAGYALAWACSVVGALDLILALSQAVRLGVAVHLAGQWYVPALGVPLMGVAHVGCALALLQIRRAAP